jgi:hypothetical protein
MIMQSQIAPLARRGADVIKMYAETAMAGTNNVLAGAALVGILKTAKIRNLAP